MIPTETDGLSAGNRDRVKAVERSYHDAVTRLKIESE